MLWYQFVVHTGSKANTNKTQTSRFYVVPQNQVCPQMQQIVYYWRNDTNTQLNPIQPTKPSVSLLHLVFLSNLHFLTLTVALAHFLYSALTCTLSSLCLSLYKKEESWQQPMCSLINANQLLQEESHGGWKKVDKFATVSSIMHQSFSYLYVYMEMTCHFEFQKWNARWLGNLKLDLDWVLFQIVLNINNDWLDWE